MSNIGGIGGTAPIQQPDKPSKAESSKTKLQSKGTSEVARSTMTEKTKETAKTVLGGIKKFLGKNSKATDTNIAKTVEHSLNVGRPVNVVAPARMAEAGQKVQDGIQKLKDTNKELEAAKAVKKELTQALQENIESGGSTVSIRLKLAENEYQMAKLAEKANAERRELVPEAKILLKSSSSMESTQAAEILSENHLPTLESEKKDLHLNTNIARLKFEIAKAVSEGKSKGTIDTLKAQLSVEQAKGTKDESIIRHAEEQLENLSLVTRLEAKIDSVGHIITPSEKMILNAQLAVAKAEESGNSEKIRNAKNEEASCRLLDETAKTENTYLSGLRNLDLIVDNVLGDMPELQSFSEDLKRHVQIAEEFSGQMNQIMNKEGGNASDMAAQLFEKGLVERYAKSFEPLITNYEENSAQLNKIDLTTNCPPSLVEARNSGSLQIGGLAITPIQRMPRYRMLLEGIMAKSPSEKLQESLQTVLDEASRIGKTKS